MIKSNHTADRPSRSKASLTMLGLSSLGRREAHLMITLEALCAALTRIACVGTQFFPSTGGLAEGYLALEPAPHRLFGTNPNGPQRA